MNETPGLFITLSGGEGSGKSTQVRVLGAVLSDLYNIKVYCTKQPGGTPFGAQLREILLHSEKRLSPLDELNLFCTDRSHHAPIIEGHLMAGSVVICDCYADDNVAYQGYARGIDLGFVKERAWEAAHGVIPHRSYFCMVDPVTGIERTSSRKDTNTRFDNEQLEFHQRVFAGFEQIYEENPDRVRFIDANKKRDKVFHEIFEDITTNYGHILEEGR